ncbi:MAG: hypothetical protein Q7S28_02345 [bacterium]|nr:hypothetical protein [bacterium]
MSHESGEKFESRLNDPGFLEKLKKAFVDALLEEATDPKGDLFGYEQATRDIMADKKTRGDSMIDGKLTKIGQDFRLTHDEIDELKQKFLDSE